MGLLGARGMMTKALVTMMSGESEINRTLAVGEIVPTLGEELFADPSFDSAPSWLADDGWAVSGGDATASPSVSYKSLVQDPIGVGLWCQLSFVVSAYTAGACYHQFGASAELSSFWSGTGTKPRTALIVDGNGTGIRVHTASDLTLSDASCKAWTLSVLQLGKLGRKTGTWQCTPTVAAGKQAGLWINYLDANNNVQIVVDREKGHARLWKIVAGIPTLVIGDAISYVAGQSLKCVVSGTNYSLYYNNIQVGSTRAIADTMGTEVYGFTTDATGTPGTVTTNP